MPNYEFFLQIPYEKFSGGKRRKRPKRFLKVKIHGAGPNLVCKQNAIIFLAFFLLFPESFLLGWIRIRIFNVNPDPGRKMNADPDPDPQP